LKIPASDQSQVAPSAVGKHEPLKLRALLIHGAGGGAWEWRIWQRVLKAKGIDAIAIDLLDAEAPIAEQRYDDYLQRVATHYAQHRCNVLIGASLGGLLAAELCAALCRQLTRRDVEPVIGQTQYLTQTSPVAMVLVAPVPPSGRIAGVANHSAVKTWAHRHDLADTIQAIPDAYPADQYYASQSWRDESGSVLAALSSPRALAPHNVRSLMVIGTDDRDIDPQDLYRWADLQQMALLPVSASHVGLLMGRPAARTATSVADWLALDTKTVCC
jgi:pimeloyl-ACP methyl ester carboxylesterase